MENIKEQIKKAEAKVEKLKKILIEQQDKTNWVKIPELKIEVQSKIHHKGKSYNELKEEFGEEYLDKHLPTYSQLQTLRNLSNKYDLGLIDTWEFVKQEDIISKKNGYVARFVAYSGWAGLSCDGYATDGSDSLGVRFVREIKK